MQTMRDVWDQRNHQKLFNDDYGILKLAAELTLTKTPAPSEVNLQRGQWRKRILAIMKQLWPIKTITCSQFIWLEPEIYPYKMIGTPCIKPATNVLQEKF